MGSYSFTKLTSSTPLKKVFLFDEINSTNDRARSYLKRIRKPFSGPILFAANRQTAGRGRGSHIWWSYEGGLFLTYVAYRSDFGLTNDNNVELSLRTAKAVAETVRCTTHPIQKGYSIRVKHPNDVLFNDKKIAGILIESPLPELAVIGIGINLNSPKEPIPLELKGNFTCLEDISGKPFDPYEFVLKMTQELFR